MNLSDNKPMTLTDIREATKTMIAAPIPTFRGQSVTLMLVDEYQEFKQMLYEQSLPHNERFKLQLKRRIESLHNSSRLPLP